MTLRTIPFYKPEFSKEQRQLITQSIDEILESGRLMMGPWKDRFEAQFRDISGCSEAVSLNSATTALQIALEYFGAKGCDVLVPAGAFLTDVSSVVFAGGNPILVDIRADTLSFDFDDLEQKLTPRSKGIIWVHLTGQISSDHERLIAFARTHNLFVIEDAAHAHGASIDGKAAGSLGDVGVFSFYPTKIVTAGTGGMLTTCDGKLAEFARQMRMFGKDDKGEILHLGNDWFLDEIRACVGTHHTAELENQLARRRQIAGRYNDNFTSTCGFNVFNVPQGHLPAWYHYFVMLDDHVDRKLISKQLADEDGIATKPIYRPLHHEKVFCHLDDGSLKQTEQVLDRALCLPLYVGLSDDDVDYVSDRLVERIKSHA